MPCQETTSRPGDRSDKGSVEQAIEDEKQQREDVASKNPQEEVEVMKEPHHTTVI